MIPPTFGPVHKKTSSVDNTANDASKRISDQTQKRLSTAILLFSSDKEEAIQIAKTIEQLTSTKHPTSSKEYRDKIKLIESSIKGNCARVITAYKQNELTLEYILNYKDDSKPKITSQPSKSIILSPPPIIKIPPPEVKQIESPDQIKEENTLKNNIDIETDIKPPIVSNPIENKDLPTAENEKPSIKDNTIPQINNDKPAEPIIIAKDELSKVEKEEDKTQLPPPSTTPAIPELTTSPLIPEPIPICEQIDKEKNKIAFFPQSIPSQKPQDKTEPVSNPPQDVINESEQSITNSQIMPKALIFADNSKISYSNPIEPKNEIIERRFHEVPKENKFTNYFTQQKKLKEKMPKEWNGINPQNINETLEGISNLREEANSIDIKNSKQYVRNKIVSFMQLHHSFKPYTEIEQKRREDEELTNQLLDISIQLNVYKEKCIGLETEIKLMQKDKTDIINEREELVRLKQKANELNKELYDKDKATQQLAFAISNLTQDNKSLNEMISDQNEIITSLQSQIKALKEVAPMNKPVTRNQEHNQNESIKKPVKKEAPQVKAPAPKKENIIADDDVEFFESVINSGR